MSSRTCASAPRPPGSSAWCRARGWRERRPRSWTRCSVGQPERLLHVGRAAQDPEAGVEASPALECVAIQPQRREQRRCDGRELGLNERLVGARDSHQLLDRRGAVRDGGLGALPQLGEHRVHQVRALVQRLARDREHQLRVARRPIVVHPELAGVDAALPQRHALGVPERHDGIHVARRSGSARPRSRSSPVERARSGRRRSQRPHAGPRRPRAVRSRPPGGPRGRAGGARSEPRAITAASGR